MILKYLTLYRREDSVDVDRWNFISGLTEIGVYPSMGGGVDIDMTADKNCTIHLEGEAYILNDNGSTMEKIHS